MIRLFKKIPFTIRLVLLIVLLPCLEIGSLYLFSWFFDKITMYCVIITSGILGIVLARWQGDRCWRELNRKLDKNEVPTDTILHGLLIFLAGICLILPGMFSDLIGVLLLLPPVRNKVIFYGLDKFRKYREELHRKERNTPKKQDDDVIDID